MIDNGMTTDYCYFGNLKCYYHVKFRLSQINSCHVSVFLPKGIKSIFCTMGLISGVMRPVHLS